MPLTNAASDITENDIKVLNVPLFEGLSIETILEFSKRFPDVEQYLPDERDMGRLPRKWICNVVYTVVGQPFRTWVSDKIRKRNDAIAGKRDLLIDLDPRIASAF